MTQNQSVNPWIQTHRVGITTMVYEHVHTQSPLFLQELNSSRESHNELFTGEGATSPDF